MENNKGMKKLKAMFFISWFSLAAACFIIVILLAQNVKLKNKNFISERKIKELSSQIDQYNRLKQGMLKSEKDIADYIQWKFVLQDQVSQSGRRINNVLSKLKNQNAEPAGLLYYNLGLHHTMAMNFNSAIDAFENAVKVDPRDADSYYNLGLLYSTQNYKSKEAVKNYKKFLELAPSDARSREVRGRISTLEKAK